VRRINARERTLFASAVLVAAFCAPLLAYGGFARSSSRLTSAITTRGSLAQDAGRLRTLLDRSAVVDDRPARDPRAEQRLFTRIESILLGSGIDRGAVSDVRIDEPRSIQASNGSARYALQRAEIGRAHV